jgi:hypothetical protein
MNNQASRLPPRNKASKEESKQISHLDGDGFDKQEWIRYMKNLKKDYILEDRERFRPILSLKRDLKEFVEDFEKEEKKNEMALRKE